MKNAEICNNTLIFKRLLRNTTHSGMNKVEALKVFREGLIRIESKDPSIIGVYWEVNLGHLLFFSCFIGLILGLITLANSNFIIALLFTLIPFSIGRYVIQSNIDNIIERQSEILKRCLK